MSMAPSIDRSADRSVHRQRCWRVWAGAIARSPNFCIFCDGHFSGSFMPSKMPAYFSRSAFYAEVRVLSSFVWFLLVHC